MISAERILLLLATMLVAGTLPHALFGQPGGEPIPPPLFQDTVVLTPQKNYDRGGTHRFFFGDLWRDAWGTEITVPVLDLNRTGGGLTVSKLGGGTQTKSLRFLGEDGREYKFRSVDKDPSGILPRGLQETLVDDVLQDMIASGSPVGPLVAAPILDAVEIPNPRPWLAVLPDDPRLGTHREEFAGMLGMIEVHPNEGPGDTPGFMGYDKIVGWESLFEDLREENDELVDHVEFLKASLVDMLIGDWDRHYDQWRWAQVEREDGVDYWLPIPRDRDQALSRFDGVLPSLAVSFSPELEDIDGEYRSIEELTYAGRYLDRRMLPPVSRREWDSVTRFIVDRVSDQVIDEAIARVPAEIRAIEGERIRETLRSRRDNLAGASARFFHFINTEPELWGSDDPEVLLVDRIDNERLRVRLFRREKKSGRMEEPAFIDRTFDRGTTKEVRVTLLGGDDSVHVSGHVSSSIPVRIDGGDGADTYIDDSKVDGFFFITPIPDAETMTWFYDHGKKSSFTLGAGTRIDRGSYPLWEHDSVAWHPPLRDYGSSWALLPWLDYDSDAGVFLGARYVQTRYGYRQDPWAYEFSIGAGYALGSRAFKGAFDGTFRNWVPNATVLTNLTASEIDIFNFFGLGNETPFDQELYDADYYDVRQRRVFLDVNLQVPRRSSFTMLFGLHANYTRTKPEESPFLGQIYGASLYGVEPTGLAGVRTGVQFDSRDSENIPTEGFFIEATSLLFPTIWDNRETFMRVRLEGRTYLSWDLLRPTTLALRALHERIVGDDYPFYEAAYLGGSNSLRGYSGDRFAGDASLLGNAELRMHLFNLNLITRNRIGLIFFAESGRVYLDGEESDRWHHGYGTGFSLGLAGTPHLVSATVGKSEESDARIVLSYGFLY